MLSTNLLLAQEGPFIRIIDGDEVELSEAEQAVVDSFTSNGDIDQYFFAEIGSVVDYQDSGRLDVVYSNNTTNIRDVQATFIDYTTPSKYEWGGRTDDEEFYISLVSYEDGTGGFIHDMTEEKYQHILPLKPELSLFLEYDISGTPQYLCSQEFNSNSSGVNTPPHGPLSDCSGICPGKIDILFLLTPEVIDFIPNERYFNIVINQLNFAFSNSRIPHKVNYYVDELDFTQGSICVSDAMSLSDNITAQQLRSSYNADLVFLIADQTYGSELGCVAAIGPLNDEAYSIIPLKHLYSQFYTFPHELGHLFGAHHHVHGIYDPKKGLCAYAHRLTQINKRTIVTNGKNIPHYSDPYINYQGYPTGKVPKFDPPVDEGAVNAGQIRSQGCTLGNFKGSTFFPPAEFSLDRTNCKFVLQADQTLTSIPGTTFEWRWSFDGFFSTNYPGTLLGSGSTLNATEPPVGDCKYYFVQLVVKQNGVIQSRTSKIIRGSQCIPQPNGCP